MLTDDDKAILDFAGKTYRHRGAQEQDILDTFGLPAARYWQQVGALIDREDALAYSPVLVNRLRRQRDQRRQHRAAG